MLNMMRAYSSSMWAISASLVEDTLLYIPPSMMGELVRGYVFFLVLGGFMHLLLSGQFYLVYVWASG